MAFTGLMRTMTLRSGGGSMVYAEKSVSVGSLCYRRLCRLILCRW
jgi:hypothetical protein